MVTLLFLFLGGDKSNTDLLLGLGLNTGPLQTAPNVHPLLGNNQSVLAGSNALDATFTSPRE